MIANPSDQPTSQPTTEGVGKDFFFVHANYKQVKLFCDDVLYIQGLKDYVKIFTDTQSKAILTRHNLKGMEAILPPGRFIRVHNSFIVNANKITAFQKNHVFIRQNTIPIGEKFATRFKTGYGIGQ